MDTKTHVSSVTHHLLDYEKERAGFQWDQVYRELAGLPDQRGLNIAYEAVDRHAIQLAATLRLLDTAVDFLRDDHFPGSTEALRGE